MHVRETKESYAPVGSAPVINGAAISAEFVPLEATGAMSASAMVLGAARARLIGPWEVYLLAKGKPGEQVSMVVHTAAFRTDRGQAEAVPARLLGRSTRFSPSRLAGVTQAAYRIPAELEADFTKDKSIQLTLDVSVSTSASTQRKRFTLDCPAVESKNVQNLFIPKEIVDSFRHDDVPHHQADLGVNRQ